METLIFFSGILATCVITAVVCLFVHSPKKRALMLMSVYLILFIMLSILNFLASDAHAADGCKRVPHFIMPSRSSDNSPRKEAAAHIECIQNDTGNKTGNGVEK